MQSGHSSDTKVVGLIPGPEHCMLSVYVSDTQPKKASVTVSFDVKHFEWSKMAQKGLYKYSYDQNGYCNQMFRN